MTKAHKAYEYRIYPTLEQIILINKTIGSSRFIYNRLLEERKNVYIDYKDDKEKLKNYKYQTPASFKEEFPWLKEVDSLALSNAQMNLKQAYSNFFTNPKHFSEPHFKGKHSAKQSYTTNNQKGSIRIIDKNTIRIPILKNLNIKLHRPLPDDVVIKSATIKRTATGKFFISICFEYEEICKAFTYDEDKVIGLDYTSNGLYTDSDGKISDYPRYYRKNEKRLAVAQKKLARRQKDGKNREKQRIKVAKISEKTKNQRKNYLHQNSRKIVNSYCVVVIEDINMKSISQCLKLGKSTLDNGFGMFRRMLEYKLHDQGKRLILVPKNFPSSKLCNVCTTKNIALKLSDRVWTCKECGTTHDRDINAAINIRNKGLELLKEA